MRRKTDVKLVKRFEEFVSKPVERPVPITSLMIMTPNMMRTIELTIPKIILTLFFSRKYPMPKIASVI